MNSNRYEFFSPSEVVRKYFSEFAGSTQNKNHSISLEYQEKVEKLRKDFSSFLGIKDSHLISLQFNQYYIEQIIFSFLGLDSSWKVYSSNLKENKDFLGATVYSLKEIESHSALQTKEKILIWIDGLKNIDLELFEAIQRWKAKHQAAFFIFLSLDYFLYSIPKIRSFIQEVSFLSFNPSHLFQEYGTVLFTFQKKLELTPFFIGSGAAKLNTDTKKLELRELPYSLEIGTQNLISLIILERFFHFLNIHSEEISQRLVSPYLNFNLKENWKNSKESLVV